MGRQARSSHNRSNRLTYINNQHLMISELPNKITLVVGGLPNAVIRLRSIRHTVARRAELLASPTTNRLRDALPFVCCLSPTLTLLIAAAAAALGGRSHCQRESHASLYSDRWDVSPSTAQRTFLLHPPESRHFLLSLAARLCSANLSCPRRTSAQPCVAAALLHGDAAKNGFAATI